MKNMIRRWRIPTLLAFAVLITMVVVAVFAPWLAPTGYDDQDYTAIYRGASSEHWLGTDLFGRDILSRLIFGARVSLGSAAVAVGVASVLGLPAGLLAGYVGGRLDSVIMRVVDILLAFPTIVLAIGVTAMLGVGMTNAMIAVGVVLAPSFARVMRAQTLVVKNRLYVDSARTFGASRVWVVSRHIVPNAIQPVLVLGAHMLGVALLVEASLSFLGLGTPAPLPSWGSMLQDATRSELRGFAVQIVSPGLAIAITLLSINTIGDVLRDKLDPRQITKNA